jgi:hypothetical protein
MALHVLVVILLVTIDTATTAVAEMVLGGFALVVQAGIIQPLLHALVVVDGMAQALVLSACLAA